MPVSVKDASNSTVSVPTLDDVLGSKTDAKSTATDATSTSGIAIFKQISASVQGAALETGGNLAAIFGGLGAAADAIVAAGAAGSASAKLRRATQGLEDLKSLIVLAAGANIIGKVAIDQSVASTALSRFTTAITASTAISAKASAGNLYAVSAINRNTTSIRYLQLHDKASAPTSGNVPVDVWEIPAGTSTQSGSVSLSVADFGSAGYRFTTGIALAVSTTQGTYTAATASEHIVNGGYV